MRDWMTWFDGLPWRLKRIASLKFANLVLILLAGSDRQHFCYFWRCQEAGIFKINQSSYPVGAPKKMDPGGWQGVWSISGGVSSSFQTWIRVRVRDPGSIYFCFFSFILAARGTLCFWPKMLQHLRKWIRPRYRGSDPLRQGPCTNFWIHY